MLNKIRSLETNFSVKKAAFLIGILTLASRLVGLYRDRLFASHFGAGDILDIYYASFKIPDFVFNLLILGTLSAAFIPIFSDFLIKDKVRANRIASTVLNASFLGMLVICIILFIFATPFTHIVVPGFTGSKFINTVNLTRVLLISPLLFTASNVFSGMLIALKRFVMVNLAPIFYNLGIIFGLVFLYPQWGLKGLGAGVILGAGIHFLVQAIEAIRLGFVWQPILDFKDQGVKTIARLFLPRVFGMDSSYISPFIAAFIGSTLASGSIAVYSLAFNLEAVPIGIFALSTAIAVFPVLSEAFSKKEFNLYVKSLGQSIGQILFFIVPISILMLLFRAYIVRLAFGAGKFGWQDTILTFSTLGIMSFALLGQSLVPLLSRAFYARHNTKIPVFVSIISLFINAGSSYFLAQKSGVVGIAEGFVLASTFNCLALFAVLAAQLVKEGGPHNEAIHNFSTKLFRLFLKIVLGTILMGSTALLLIRLIAPLVNTHTVIGILIQSGIASSVSIMVYVLVTWKFKVKESIYLIGLVKKYIFRQNIST